MSGPVAYASKLLYVGIMYIIIVFVIWLVNVFTKYQLFVVKQIPEIAVQSPKNHYFHHQAIVVSTTTLASKSPTIKCYKTVLKSIIDLKTKFEKRGEKAQYMLFLAGAKLEKC